MITFLFILYLVIAVFALAVPFYAIFKFNRGENEQKNSDK